MTLAELVAKWTAREAEWSQLGVACDGGKLAREILCDLAMVRADASNAVTPVEAARASGYHPESICRLIRTGKIVNYGTPRRPRVRLDEIPRKAARRVASIAPNDLSSAALARDAIAGRIGRNDP
jgi:hypothetical protein